VRWCTLLKRAAVRSVINNMFSGKRLLVVLGDRDAESTSRSRKGLIEVEDSNIINVYPIKLWSALHVFTYLKLNNIPLNKLYRLGFYRIGCFICPALRDWELSIILSNDDIKHKYYNDWIGFKYLKAKKVL